MGRELYETFLAAREVFQEVDETLGENLSKIIFEGPEEALGQTQNTQPALMAVSLAVLRVLEKESNNDVWKNVKCVAGHSLGEYSALAAAGAMTIAQAAHLLRCRGEAMQRAVPAGEGALAAILGLDIETVLQIAEDARESNVCVVANDNAPGQVVLSGHRAAIDRAMALASIAGAKRSILLPVSVPSHCPLMLPAAEEMADVLGDTTFKAPKVPVIVNVTAQETTDPAAFKGHLIEQLTGRVRWRESVDTMFKNGVTTFVELGAGRVLSGLNKRIAPNATNMSIQGPQDIEAFLTRS
jgi:[acyl-carrier-protein] S-malonyltransferase